MALDIIFLSYDEPHADHNFRLLTDMCPYAKRVHGVQGIREAHVAAANTAQTSSFFVVDADCIVEPDRAGLFEYKPEPYDKKYLHLWYSLNPVNGLIYGYGGIKLFSKSMFKQIPDGTYVDFSSTMGEGLKIMSEADTYASVTHFNADSFTAFRGGFREAAKLTKAAATDEVAKNRLDVWCSISDNNVAFSFDALNGARAGHLYASSFDDISDINNLDWLKEQYAIFT